jgi:hypothetical protein
MSEKNKRTIKITIEDDANPDVKIKISHTARLYEFQDEYEDIIRDINISVDQALREFLG